MLPPLPGRGEDLWRDPGGPPRFLAGGTPKGSPGDPEGTRRRRARVSRWRDPEQKPGVPGGLRRARVSFRGPRSGNPEGLGRPVHPPRLGFSRGDPPNGSSGVLGALSVPVPRFPARAVPNETLEGLARPAVPVPVFLLEDREREPGGFRGAPSPRTNLAGRRTWRARRGGSGSADPQLFPPGTPGGVAPFPLYPPPPPQSAQKGGSQTQPSGQGGAGGGAGDPLGGPRRVHHLSAPESANCFYVDGAPSRPAAT